MMGVDKLANFIRKVNGNNTMGAGALADEIVMFLAKEQANTAQEQAASVPVGLWSLIDAYADQKATYVYSQFTKSQRENVEFAKAELSKALNSIATPVAPAHALTDAEIKTLTDIAEWLDSQTNVQQIAPDEWSHASQFDYELSQASFEISVITTAHLARKG